MSMDATPDRSSAAVPVIDGKLFVKLFGAGSVIAPVGATMSKLKVCVVTAPMLPVPVPSACVALSMPRAWIVNRWLASTGQVMSLPEKLS